MKVLVVDDDKISAKLLSRVLEKRSFDVHVVNNGQACIDFVESDRPDIVLLDIMMPEISGIEVLEVLRKTYTAFELPIIMVTAKSDAADVVEALKKGANDYITKPINDEVAVARIKTQGSLRHLYNESLYKKELETLNAMIITYNHEINNPLTIAFGMLNSARSKKDISYLDKVETALERITEIVKKIDGLTQEGAIEEKEYTSGDKMFKIE